MKMICIEISFVYDKSFHIMRRTTLECITFYAISGGKKLQTCQSLLWLELNFALGQRPRMNLMKIT